MQVLNSASFSDRKRKKHILCVCCDCILIVVAVFFFDKVINFVSFFICFYQFKRIPQQDTFHLVIQLFQFDSIVLLLQLLAYIYRMPNDSWCCNYCWSMSSINSHEIFIGNHVYQVGMSSTNSKHWLCVIFDFLFVCFQYHFKKEIERFLVEEKKKKREREREKRKKIITFGFKFSFFFIFLKRWFEWNLIWRL